MARIGSPLPRPLDALVRVGDGLGRVRRVVDVERLVQPAEAQVRLGVVEADISDVVVAKVVRPDVEPVGRPVVGQTLRRRQVLLAVDVEHLGAAVGQGAVDDDVRQHHPDSLPEQGVDRDHQPLLGDRGAEEVCLGPGVPRVGGHVELDVAGLDHASWLSMEARRSG